MSVDPEGELEMQYRLHLHTHLSRQRDFLVRFGQESLDRANWNRKQRAAQGEITDWLEQQAITFQNAAASIQKKMDELFDCR